LSNPVHRIFETGQPFVFFHTHVIDREVLDAATAAHKSLEIDLNITGDGSFFIGHSPSHYSFSHLPPPSNLPLDVVLKEAQQAGLFLVLDCKDVRVLGKAQEIIEQYGAGNCLYHSWSDALVLDLHLEDLEVVQPNWPGEELPHAAIVALRQATNVPLALSCRWGLTEERLHVDGDLIADRILTALDGCAAAVNFALQEGNIPLPVMRKLIDNGVLPVINIDRTPIDNRPSTYLGSSDILANASAWVPTPHRV
jgi:hypothetical protein